MLCPMGFIRNFILPGSGWRYLAFGIPEIFPRLTFFPEKHLPLNQSAIAVDRADRSHFIGTQGLAHDGFEIAEIMAPVRGKRYRNLAALDCPLHTHYSRMHFQPGSYFEDHRILGWFCVLGSTISLGPPWRTHRAIPDRNHSMRSNEIE